MNGQFVLVMNYGSYAPREFIIVGGAANEKMAKIKLLTQVEFYVPNDINDRTVPIVFLQKFLSAAP